MNQLASILTATAQRHPDLLAIEGPSGATTYRQLVLEAAKFSEELRDRQVDSIAICGERGIRLITLTVGAVLADCAVVLLDPQLPAQRREYMLAESGAASLVTVSEDSHQFSDLASSRSHAGSDYVFFTSGTTGQPKAIGGRWNSVAHFAQWQASSFAFGPGDRVAQLTGLSFDVVLRDIFTTLISGATLCVPPVDLSVGPDGILNWLRSEAITVMHAVPSLAAKWMSSQTAAQGTSMRATFFAGEPLHEGLARRWCKLFPRTEIVNLYGPTETTMAKFHYKVDFTIAGLQPVGTPLPDTEARIVDEEIWIHTAFGTNGYLNDEEAQQRSFTIGDDGREWYRTGDVGRIDDSGMLWVLGRKDLQVKINGNRIEPVGIAAVLSEHPAVAHSVVTPHSREDGSIYLAAFYTTNAESPGTDDLRAWLGERLPAAHIPAIMHRLPELPTTPNGKVDRGALPDPAVLLSADRVCESPQSDLDAEVLNEFSIVLPDVPQDMNADFFEFGGTSIEAVELTARLESATGKHWEMSDIYRFRTPRALSDAARTREVRDRGAIPALGTQMASTGLSPQQRRYRRVYLPNVNRSWSNMVALFALPENVHETQVEKALNAVIARHDSLRAYFPPTDGNGLEQHFKAQAHAEVAVEDLSSAPLDEHDALIDRLRLQEANSPIDIDRWPLFRAKLVKHGRQQRTLLWNVHHMVSDGYSQGLLHRELRHLLSGGDPDQLPEIPISYRDYIDWAEGEGAKQAAQQADWWQQVYAEPYERPLLPRRSGIEDAAGGIAYQFPIPEELHAAVERLCRRTGSTPFTTYLTALFSVAYDLFDTDDLVIGTPASGRLRSEFEHMIGNFISLVGIRCRQSEGEGFEERVRLVRDRTVAAMEHQNYQYDQVMEDIGATADDDRFPLTTVFLSLMDIPAPLPSEAVHRQLGCEVKFDLMGYLRRHDGKLWMELQTRRELMTERQLEAVEAGLLSCIRNGVHLGED